MKTTQQRRKKAGWPKVVTVGNASVRVYKIDRKVGDVVYPLFQVANHSTGKRKLESFSDDAAAIKRAEQLARLIAEGDVAAADFSSRDAASYGRGMELLRPTGDSLETACDRYAVGVKILGGDGARLVEACRYFAKRNPDTLPQKPVKDVVAELIEALGADASKRYLGDLRSRLGRFAGDFKVSMGSITTADIQLWLDGLKLSAQSRLNFQRVINRLFAFAKARGYVIENPVESAETIKVKNGGKVAIYTAKEIAALLHAAPADFLPSLVIGAFCGLRSAEIERLTWSSVDLADGHLTVAADDAKTASRRIVPIPDNARAWLAPYAGRSGPVWIGGHDAFYDAQQATADGAGVKWKANALRHSFCSYRLALVKNAAQVALEAGNSAAVIFKHYRELVKERDALAWFAITPARPSNVVTINTKAANG